MNKEAVQMFATPAECILKDFVEFGDTGCADHEQSPPHQRTHAAEHYAKLIDRNGRYRRFRHANSLSKRKPTVLNLMTPRNLPLSYIELGQTYAQMGKTADARRLIAKGLAMPDVEKDDPEIKRRGRETLAKLQ
jgi:hypothetical protein